MNGKMRSIALPRAIDSGTLVPKTMNFRLAAIALFVAIAANGCDKFGDTLGDGGKAIAFDARPLTPRQVVALNHLAFPQWDTSIQSRFGEPAYRDGNADYYPLPNGATEIVVYLGPRAQSMEVR
jgi:hypothetical protein